MPKAIASSRRLLPAIAILIVAGTFAISLAAEEELEPLFDDEPQIRQVKYPDWFKLSFLDLRADVREAVAAGKRGLIVYFGQAHCAYCEALLEINFNDPEIVAYTQEHFDVVPVDIWGKQIVITPTGKVMTEEALAIEKETNFTPTVLF